MSTNLNQFENGKVSNADGAGRLDLTLSNNTNTQLQLTNSSHVGKYMLAPFPSVDPGGMTGAQLVPDDCVKPSYVSINLTYALANTDQTCQIEVSCGFGVNGVTNSYTITASDSLQCLPPEGWPNTDAYPTLTLTLNDRR